MTVFFAKAIKPPKLKIDEVRLAILNALKKEGRLEAKKLQETTQHWKGAKPTFDFTVSLAGGKEALLLTGVSGDTEGAQKWIWLNYGTKRHVITARRAPFLQFRVGGRAGSTPRSWSTSAAVPGTEPRRARRVMHPGTKAREWTILLYEERWQPFAKAVNDALEQGMKKAMS